MAKYKSHFSTSTPQFQRIADTEQIRNRAGGWAFPITDEAQAERFLVMGTEGGSFYCRKPDDPDGAKELTREAATCIDRLLEVGKGTWLVGKIREISQSGRAPRNDAAIFALAMCIKLGDEETRRLAANAMPSVCRTATDMFKFLELAKVFSRVRKIEHDNGKITYEPQHGWGRVMKRAVTNWLDNKDNERLAYQMIKYRQREGWTMRDILRKAKPAGRQNGPQRDALYAYAVDKAGAFSQALLPEIIEGFKAAQTAENAEEIVGLVTTYNLPWEAIPSKWARNLDVQAALFERMPITATIRQLGRLTSIGLIAEGSDATRQAIARLTNPELLRRGRVHPMNLYLANEVYRVGQGLRGKLSWTPVQAISDGLSQAFFQSFGAIQPSGKNIVVGIDSSQSMSKGGVMGIPQFRCVEAAFVSAYVQTQIEPNCRVLLFDSAAYPLTFPAGLETLSELQEWGRKVFRSGGSTNCAAPIVFAHQNYPDVDAFVLYTDNETWYGRPHPIEALWQYRKHWGRKDTKLISQAFVPNNYSITPMEDAACLAVIGMDEAAPSLISDFCR